MDKIVYRFSLDCQRSGAQRFIEGLVQGEVSNRQLVISLTQNGESVTLADNNLVAVMNCHEVSHPCEIKDNKVIYDFQPSDYAIAGESIYQLMIMTAESPRRVLFTPSFYVNVADADGDLVGSDEEYSALQEAIRKAEVVYETRLIGITYEDDGSLIFRFADGREMPIDTLKEVLEQERDREQRFGDMSQDFDSWTATEDARQNAEAQRVLAERIRVNDEYQRDDNEGNRQADEQLRHEAERERKIAEAKREETMNSYLEDMNVALADASTAINKMNEILQNDFPTPDEQMEWTEAYEKVRDVRKSEVDYLHGITANTSFSGGTIADKFDSVYAKTNSIEATHSAYEQRMDGVVDQMNSRIGENSYKTNSLDTRVTRLEQSGGGGGDVPIATTEVAGKVKPDGSTITVDTDGTIHAVGGGGGGGTSDYNALANKPKVNGVTLSGNKDFHDLGLDTYIQNHHEELKGDTGPQGPQGIQGIQGPKGDKGDTGYTPIKGVDYYTDTDKAEIVQAVLVALPTAEGSAF